MRPHKSISSSPSLPLLTIPQTHIKLKSTVTQNPTHMNTSSQLQSLYNNMKQVDDTKVDSMIQEQMLNTLTDNSINKVSIKSQVQLEQSRNKSSIQSFEVNSVEKANCNYRSEQKNRNKHKIGPEAILESRYKRSKQEIRNQIEGLQKQCDKFGGAKYIKDEMNKQQISTEQLFDFYKQRITSIHGSLSLPRIQPRVCNLTSTRKLNPQAYNKWYVNPQKRFKKNIQHQSQVNQLISNKDINTVTKYVQKLFTSRNKDVTFKYQYAPTIIKESAKILGRQPVLCTYAKIARR